ncbi:MAG: hypothetical protein IJ158_02705 [Treponema sp.]|nr:hypothetical protein [Treponema sp.]
MNFVCVCTNCRKTIEKDFLYCPWCGTQNTEPSDNAVLETVFSQLEAKQCTDRITRIKKIETKIAEIERGLEELAKRNQE